MDTGYYEQDFAANPIEVEHVVNAADFNQLLVMVFWVVLALIGLFLYIILVVIPFVQRLRYYKIELGRATDDKKPRWKKRIFRLYFSLIPFVGPIIDYIRHEEYRKIFKIFKRRKRRRRRRRSSSHHSSHHSSHYHHEGHHHSHHHHDGHHHHHHHDEHGEGKAEKRGE